MSELTFQAEAWSAIAEEIKPLLALHWSEVGNFRDAVPLDPDWQSYLDLEARGTLHVTTARDGGRLVGYYVAYVMPHPHYKSTLFGFVDVFFMLPEYRRAANGIGLFQAMEAAMRDRMKSLGHSKMVLVSRGRMENDPTPMFRRLGWDVVETAYVKLLTEA